MKVYSFLMANWHNKTIIAGPSGILENISNDITINFDCIYCIYCNGYNTQGQWHDYIPVLR